VSGRAGDDSGSTSGAKTEQREVSTTESADSAALETQLLPASPVPEEGGRASRS
jgi:hypothetical protein